MIGISKLKNNFIQIVKEHPISVVCVLVAMILRGIFDFGFEMYSNVAKVGFCSHIFLLIFAVGVLPLEIYRAYKRKADENYSFRNKKYVTINVVVMVVSAVLGFLTTVVFGYSEDLPKLLGMDQMTVDYYVEYIYRILAVFVTAAICASLYLFYKKSGCSFEAYVAKAFCGVMKAALVDFVICIGVALIIGAIDTLLTKIDYGIAATIYTILLGLILYPCTLAGLSKTEPDISKFGKIMLGYVFTGLLAIAFLIIYIYIFKIIFTLKIPSNQVFGILTTLFAFGVFIWTMAQGVCNENVKKIYVIMPLLFIPFIVLQIISLSIRIKGYGLTINRYVGVTVIVFELAYFAVYLFNMIKKKAAMHVVLLIVAAIVFIALLMPGINAYASVINSHKGKLLAYIQNADNADENTIREAYEAYDTLYYSCGAAGERYIKKNMDDDSIEKLKIATGSSNYDYGDETGYISVDRTECDKFDISGDYTCLYIVSARLDESESGEITGEDIELYSDDELVDTVNIKDVLNKIMEMEKDGVSDSDKKAVLEEPLSLNNGGKIYVSFIGMECNPAEGKITELNLDGYVLK